MQRWSAFPAVCSVIAACAGCAGDPAATSPGVQSFVVVPRARYDAAFEAACQAARAERLVPEIADRETGSIATAPRPAGSIAEPWTWHELTASEVVEGTLAFERRRAHFEFVPTGFRPDGTDVEAPLAGPVLPGSDRARSARATGTETNQGGEFELRVSVSIERQFRPGYQGSSYTRSLSGFSRDAEPGGEAADSLRDRSLWTPVARDERLERVLVARISELLAGK